MKARASALLHRARSSNDSAMLLQAHHCCWASEYDSGNLRGCCEHVEAGVSIYQQADYRDHASLYGNHDAKVCAHGNLAQVYWMQGKIGAALAEERRCFEWTQELAHLGSTIHAMDMALLHRTYRREYGEVFTQAEDLIRFTAEQGFADHRAKGLIFCGWAAAMLGEPAQGLDTLQSGLHRQQEIGTSEDFPIYLCLHGEALMACGRPDRAVEELQNALAEFESMGLKIWSSEVWRTLGDVILAADPAAVEAALRAYGQAARIAAEQGAALLGLRAAVSEARLALRTGELDRSLETLRLARAAIKEGADSADLTVADQLLRAMAKQVGRGLAPGCEV